MNHLEDGHPFQCECSRRYTTARFASKCCGKSCTDLRDGTVTAYDHEAELAAQALYMRQLEESAKAAHYECSCGERFNEVEHAKHCRKCRRYTGDSCKEVWDIDTDRIVWSR